MSQNIFAIGMDGGGTNTRAVLMDGNGTVLARMDGGGSNPHATAPEEVRETLTSLIQGVCSEAAIPLSRVSALCLAMAGVDRPADRSLIEGMVRPMLTGEQRLIIVNDSVGGMMAATDELHGLMLISGTGSICFGYHRDGRTARAGGYGHILGDEGSGYAMGVAAMKAVIKAADGRTGPTLLTGLVLGHLGLSDPSELVTWLLQVEYGKAEIASLSRQLEAAEAQGDQTAIGILDLLADDLFSVIPPVRKRLFPDLSVEVPIVFGGSNLVRYQAFQNRIRARLADSGLKLLVLLPERQAVEGAARYALLCARGG